MLTIFVTKMLKIQFFILFFCCVITKGLAQKANWYLPWENDVSRLNEDNIRGIPILLEGTNYRVLKISGLNNKKVSFKSKSNNVKISFSYLPLIKNYSNKEIIDAVLPLEMQELTKDRYFLVKFEGIKSGIDNISISIDDTSLTLSKTVLVSNSRPVAEFDINVWAYFDYNPALQGKRKKIENMLKEFGVDNIVIPPYVLPNIGDKNLSFSDLERYLPVGSEKFKRYFIFLALDKKGVKIDEKFKISYKNWINSLRKVFKNRAIPIENIYIYLIDEPAAEGVQFINNVISLDRELGFNSNFYSTFGSNINQVHLIQNNRTFLAQISSKKINFIPKFKNHRHNHWIYSVVSKSRNVKPYYFISQFLDAYNSNAKGVGVWNFCDISKAYNSHDMTKAINMGSWKTQPTNPTYDYSLIYFDKNNIYPSLRLLALSLTREDYIFLNHLLEVKSISTKNLSTINLRNNYTQWELMKFNALSGR